MPAATLPAERLRSSFDGDPLWRLYGPDSEAALAAPELAHRPQSGGDSPRHWQLSFRSRARRARAAAARRAFKTTLLRIITSSYYYARNRHEIPTNSTFAATRLDLLNAPSCYLVYFSVCFPMESLSRLGRPR